MLNFSWLFVFWRDQYCIRKIRNGGQGCPFFNLKFPSDRKMGEKSVDRFILQKLRAHESEPGFGLHLRRF